MEAYDGFYEDGRFYPVGQTVNIRGRRKVRLTVFDEPETEQTETEQAVAWREFFEVVNTSSEEVPETFDRVDFSREIIS